MTKSDVSRSIVDEKLGRLVDAVERMTTQLQGQGANGTALERMVDGQERLIALIETQGMGDGMDAESRMRLRSIDVQMLRILEEISAGRQETMAELRTDISALAKAFRQPRGTNQRQAQVARGKLGPTAGDS